MTASIDSITLSEAIRSCLNSSGLFTARKRSSTNSASTNSLPEKAPLNGQRGPAHSRLGASLGRGGSEAA